MKNLTFLAAIISATLIPAKAALLITEVDPSGSGTSAYAADWFELTNTGNATLDITGWKMDDNSNAFGSAVTLRGITSIAAGRSVVFLESNTSGSNDAALIASFKTAWFGTNVPADFLIGAYGGSGVGLSTSTDAVNIFNAGGSLIANVTFGSASSANTFDNAAGANNAAISTLSAVGVHGAFTSTGSGEIGSPGTIITPTPVPEPSTWAIGLAMLGFTGVLAIRRATAKN